MPFSYHKTFRGGKCFIEILAGRHFREKALESGTSSPPSSQWALRGIFSRACYRRGDKFMVSQSSPALRIALVGMSGAGKTFWSKRLAANGRPAISCDDGIEERLGGQLAADGYS